MLTSLNKLTRNELGAHVLPVAGVAEQINRAQWRQSVTPQVHGELGDGR